MKLRYYTKKDRWLILIMVPPTALLFNYLIFGDHYFDRLDIVICSVFITGFITVACWHILLDIALRMQMRYPLYSQTFKRLVFSLLLYIIITAFTITLVFLGYDLIHFFDYEINLTRFKWALISGMFLNIMTTSFLEGIAFYERWKKAVDETEKLKIENLQTQLASLKSQVQPHFLFNSLNTLYSLITENPRKAEKFLLSLSKVYRYLLVSSEGDLALLSAEIQFIRSYFDLLKTRYLDCITLTIQVKEPFLAYKLPSLTLQLLVENAVKHNILEKERPLHIFIGTTDNGKLIISNNLQRKTRGVSSNKVGLNNISKKYTLLKQDDIEIKVNKDSFSVVVPLIPSDHC